MTIRTLPPSPPHTLTPVCWCEPACYAAREGIVVVHNDALGVALQLHPVRIEPKERL